MLPLEKVIVMPPVGARPDRLTATLPDCPGATVTVPLWRLIRLFVIVRLVVAFWKPEALTVRMTVPVAMPFTANTAVVPPCGIVMEAGETVAIVVSLLASVTVTPFTPAGLASVTAALKLRPTPSKGPGRDSARFICVTLTVAFVGGNPATEALMSTLPALVPAVTWKPIP